MVENYCINERVRILRRNASKRWKVEEKDCHVGHLLLQAMLQDPDMINQIDGATDESESNLSVATRTIKLASAMQNYGLQPEDTVIIMGINHLDLCIPFFACLANGYSMCAIDPSGASDLTKLWTDIHPKMIFCQKSCEETVKKARKINNETCEIVVFHDEDADMETFIKKYFGTKSNYRPAVIDQSNTTALLILTSGTTGLPKVAVIPFETLLNGVIRWWMPVSEKLEMALSMATLQWMSALLYLVSGPLKGYTRLQSSAPPTAQRLISIINKYKPCITTWTPFLLGRFLVAAENVCDLSCFKYISIGGSAIEKPLLDRFRKQCKARIQLIYSMTELLVPVFKYDEEMPYGASGKALPDRYEYKLVDADGQSLDMPYQSGELWIKGNDFFKGYKNNPAETKQILTDDGWFRTGDIFYKDELGYYYFVERKTLLIKHFGFKNVSVAKVFRHTCNQNDRIWWCGLFMTVVFGEDSNLILNYWLLLLGNSVEACHKIIGSHPNIESEINIKLSPLQMEEVIKKHPSVAEACVVSVPVPEYQELPVAAILRRNGDKVSFEDLFDLLNNNIAEGKNLRTGFFFVDSFPITPSGKLHRAKVKETALTATLDVFKRNV